MNSIKKAIIAKKANRAKTADKKQKPQASVDQVGQQYRAGLNYLRSMNFATKWSEYEDMKVGKQWPQATDKTRHLPRPVFNIIELVVLHKTASVLNENIKIIFNQTEASNQENIEAANAFTNFSQSLWEELGQAEINEQVIDSAATTGTGIWHYYWDNNAKGGWKNQYIGNLAGESIDPTNCFFGNPQCKDVQKQPWIIISSRETVEEAKKRAKSHNLPSVNITSDSNKEHYSAAKNEMPEAKLTLLTKYFKGADGKVYFMQVAGNNLITPPTNMGIDLYPVEVMAWKIRKKCIYGVSEIEGLVPNQKALNFIMAMSILSVQDTAWPKIITKPGALQQQLTNVPGEVLVDNYPTGDGIKYMTPTPLSGINISLVNTIYELTRNINGSTQVATGEAFTRQMSGAAIMALQKAAGVPTEQIKKRFHRSICNIGKIWEQFFKARYNIDRAITINIGEDKEETIIFNGTKYAHIPLELKIDIGAGADYSEALMMANLENFLVQGHITFEEALEFMPITAVPYKEELLKRVKERKAKEAVQMENLDLDMNLNFETDNKFLPN